MADVGHDCHEGRCTHKKVCSEVVNTLGSEILATQAARAGVGRDGPGALYGQVAATLTWKDLNVTVSNLKGKRRTVLFNASGYAEPGKLTAIMGPSGSGKSTLLDALAGRWARNATYTGEILLNGRKQQMSYGTAVPQLPSASRLRSPFQCICETWVGDLSAVVTWVLCGWAGLCDAG